MQGDNAIQSTVGRLRSVSASAATRAINLNLQLGMWKATVTATAMHQISRISENARSEAITLSSTRTDSAPVANATELEKQYVERAQQEQVDTVSLEQSTDLKEPRQQTLPHVDPEARVSWTVALKHGLQAAGKSILTPTGFFITVYGLIVVAWGAMLFFLLLKAAPAMNLADSFVSFTRPYIVYDRHTRQGFSYERESMRSLLMVFVETWQGH